MCLLIAQTDFTKGEKDQMKSENALFILTSIIFVAVLTLLVVLTVGFFINFNKKTRFIIGKMNSADNRDKYIQLRKELRCHYLCLIPFVNKRNVLNLYNLLFYKPKHQNVQKRTDGTWHIIAPSLIGVCLCAVCLYGTSWAWFTSTQSSSVANIRAATYSVTVTVKKDGVDTTVTEKGGEFTISLESGNYEITVTANGTADNGYCTVTLCGKTYHTPQIKKDTPFTFTVSTQQKSDLTITPQWGSYVSNENITVIDSEIPKTDTENE